MKRKRLPAFSVPYSLKVMNACCCKTCQRMRCGFHRKAFCNQCKPYTFPLSRNCPAVLLSISCLWGLLRFDRQQQHDSMSTERARQLYLLKIPYFLFPCRFKQKRRKPQKDTVPPWKTADLHKVSRSGSVIFPLVDVDRHKNASATFSRFASFTLSI